MVENISLQLNTFRTKTLHKNEQSLHLQFIIKYFSRLSIRSLIL